MADGGVAGQAHRHVGAGEVLADQAQIAFVMEAAVIADDAAAFLAAVLQPVQTERGEDRGVLAAEDAKNPALFAGLVVEFPFVRRVRRRLLEVEGGALGGHVSSGWRGLGGFRCGLGRWNRGRLASSPVDYITRALSSPWQHDLERRRDAIIYRIGSGPAYGVLGRIDSRSCVICSANKQDEQRHHQHAPKDAEGEAGRAVEGADLGRLVGGLRHGRHDHCNHNEKDQENRQPGRHDGQEARQGRKALHDRGQRLGEEYRRPPRRR